MSYNEIMKSANTDNKPNKKAWRIPVIWTMMGKVTVEAETLEDAMQIAKDEDGVIPIPDNGDFLDGSWEIDCEDIEFLRHFYNDGQEDYKPSIKSKQE